jgi:hypothetical protein
MGRLLAWTQTHARSSKINDFPELSQCYHGPIAFLTEEVMGRWLAWTQTHACSSKINNFPELSFREERLLPSSEMLQPCFVVMGEA